MILDTTMKLEAILSTSTSTTQLDITVDFIEYGADGKPTIPGFVRTRTNNSTAVTILPAPVAPSKARKVIGLTAYNADVIAETLTVRSNIATTTFVYQKQSLAVGESLVYERKGGWQIT